MALTSITCGSLLGRHGYPWAIFLMLAVPTGIVLWFGKQGWL